MMQPPPLDAPFLSSLQLPDPTPIDAFNCVSEAETSAIHNFNQSGGIDMVAKGNIVASRVLGCMLYVLHERHTAISGPATDVIRREIFKTTENRDSLVYEVGAMYRDHLLLAFRKPTQETLRISPDSSPRSFDTIEQKLGQDLASPSVDYDTSRKKALARDGYRCKLTLAWQSSWCDNIQELAEIAEASETGRGDVHACHIVNDKYIGDTGRDSSATFLRILQTFGLRDVAAALVQPNGIHGLTNLVCLLSSVQSEFDSLGLWFEPTDKENEYTVHTAYSIAGGYGHWQHTVAFAVFPHRYKAFMETELPLPDPRLLTLHGICARVARMSGAARYFSEIDQDMEELMVLESDGSSSTAFFLSVLAPYTQGRTFSS